MYRCYCLPLSEKLNKSRQLASKKIINLINSKLKTLDNKKEVNIFLVDPGGLLEEYKIISNLNLKDFFNINIFLFESLEKREIFFAQNIFYKKLNKKFKTNNFKVLKLNFKIDKFFENYNKKSSYNIILSIDSLPENFFYFQDHLDFLNFLKNLKTFSYDFFFDFFSLFSLNQPHQLQEPQIDESQKNFQVELLHFSYSQDLFFLKKYFLLEDQFYFRYLNFLIFRYEGSGLNLNYFQFFVFDLVNFRFFVLQDLLFQEFLDLDFSFLDQVLSNDFSHFLQKENYLKIHNYFLDLIDFHLVKRGN